MKRIAKYFLTSLIIMISVLSLSACGTGSDSASNELDLSGIWVYEGPSTQDPTVYIELNLGEDYKYELNINTDVLADTEQETYSALITGTYDDNGTKLVLAVDEAEDPQNILLPDTEEIELGYELSGDSELITVTGLNDYFNDLPDSIEMERGNANS